MAGGMAESGDRVMGLVSPDRIRRVNIDRPRNEILHGYEQLESLTCTVADVLDALGLVGVIPASILKPLSVGQRVVGPAMTVRYVPDRLSPGSAHLTGARAQLAGHFDAYGLAAPGDVLVVGAIGDATISCLGGLSVRLARRAGLAGTIVDGAIRDVAAIREMGYPIWARGATPRTGKFRFEVAELGGVVECAGVQVNPGDLILADEDGVVVVPADRIEPVLELSTVAAERERDVDAAIMAGASTSELKRVLAPEKW